MPTYSETAPPDGLGLWVECIWRMESSEPVRAFPVMPDGCLDFLCMADGSIQAVGAMTFRREFEQPAGVVTGVRFHPGMAGAFMKVSPAELTDQTVDIGDLPLRDLRTASDVRPPSDAPNSVQRAIAAIRFAHGDIDLAWVASQTNLSPRQFRRRCEEESGLAPARLCRILRFRRARELASFSKKPDWVQIALDCGYYDQAHMIRDFNEFAGSTPVSLFSNTAVPVTGYSEPHEDHIRIAR